ncbi:ribbon-helix-helix domain-containing protein [Tessaracoccus caeni]|uniref:antitoxin n=1 Tax=Tessaracoccus caeni TaxID=3031239 RepID=UPI0023DB4920|nr:antitoxin [Tessaracoccus caeni]MDF1488968.1 antitoxin [Tessaracoccus caeni]
MTMQITVRIPDELVGFLDDEVKARLAPSRAAVVSRALERERRRRVAERDASILAAATDADDLDGLAEFAASTSLDID